MEIPQGPIGSGSPTSPPPPTGMAMDAVKLPAIFLIITSGLSVLFFLYQFVDGLLSREQARAEIDSRLSNQNIPEQLRPLIEGAASVGPFFNLAFVVASAFVLFGAVKMMGLRSFGLAMAAAIVSVIPGPSPCCCLGIPFGIWALIVLNKPEVKTAFLG